MVSRENLRFSKERIRVRDGTLAVAAKPAINVKSTKKAAELCLPPTLLNDDVRDGVHDDGDDAPNRPTARRDNTPHGNAHPRPLTQA